MSRERGPDPDCFLRRFHSQHLHRRSQRHRLRFLRLRQRRLDGHLHPWRPPSGGIPPGSSNRLYHNNRDGTFTDVTAKAGLLDPAGWAQGVCVGDYNNDGFEDLFLTYYGQNRLYRNNGDGTFTDVTAKAGLLHPHDPLQHRLHLCGLQPRRPARSVCLQLSRNRPGHRSQAFAGRAQLQLRGRADDVRPAGTACSPRISSTATTATAPLPTFPRSPGLPRMQGSYRIHCCGLRRRRRRLAGHLRGLRLHSELAADEQPRRHLSRGGFACAASR